MAHDFWDELHHTEMPVDDLPQMIINNQHRFWEDAMHNSSALQKCGTLYRKRHLIPLPNLVRFNKLRLERSNYVRNSHSRPHNGVQNWDGKRLLENGELAPLGYPGWTGWVEWVVEFPERFNYIYAGSDLFKGPNCWIHTGCGGGGQSKVDKNTQIFNYEIRIYDADWPGLARYHQVDVMWKALRGQPEFYEDD